MEAKDLAYRARALAQAHALTDAASAFRAKHVAAEKVRHGMAQFADWAAAAFLAGYCVRRVEESVCPPPAPGPARSAASDGDADLDQALGLAAALRARQPITLMDDTVVVESLDRVIQSEIAKRADQWQDQIEPADWADFEIYVAWWVTFGYGARAAEMGAAVR